MGLLVRGVQQLAWTVLLLAGVFPSATACHLGSSVREMASSAVYAAIPKRWTEFNSIHLCLVAGGVLR